MSHFFKIIFLVIALARYGAANAQVKFYATVDPEQAAKNEYIQLRLIIENANAVNQVQLPDLKDFTVISGPNQEQGMTNNNGRVTNYIALAYVLKPKRPGTFNISPAYAMIEGKKVATLPVRVTVSNQAGQSSSNAISFFNSPFAGADPFPEPEQQTLNPDFILKNGENPAEKIKRNMFIRLETDKTSCYVGEPVVATYKLYTRLPSESNMTKNPSFNGFSVIDLQQPDNNNYTKEKLNGKLYNVYIIRKAQLYPLQPGNLDLETAEIENNVHFIKSEYLDAGGRSNRFLTLSDVPPQALADQKVTLQSKAAVIAVKPLPEAGKPAGFKGAVGNFTIDATLAANAFSTDDAGELNMIISGVGNLQLITIPDIKWPQGIEGFEPRSNDDFYKATVPVSGRKMISFPFTAAQPGNYELPAMEFSFFNPKEGKYKTVTTKRLTFTVSKGTGRPKNNGVKKEEHDSGSLLNRFFNNRLRVVSVVAILILLGLITWLKTDSRKTKQKMKAEAGDTILPPPVEDIIQQQANPLAEAQPQLYPGDPALFYRELDGALKQYLYRKLNIPQTAFSRKRLTEELDRRGVANETCIRLHKLMDEIEWELYTPDNGTEKMQEIYNHSNEMIQLLNTYKA